MMQNTVNLNGTLVGEGQPCFIVAEIGINHNGDLDLARKLIDVAAAAQCNAVKFQKRTVEIVYTPEELEAPRQSPFGKTNGHLKRALEFNLHQYAEIDSYCRHAGIPWFVSCWDEPAVDQMRHFDLPCFKIASASLTDARLLAYTRAAGLPVILSTGMSTLEQVDQAVAILGSQELVLLHACSTYPAFTEELNLRVINTLRQRYRVPVGYSGHEDGISASLAAVALNGCMLERHITLDRTLWGSDQAMSLEPAGLQQLVREVRQLESALGDGVKRVHEREYPVIKKLRRVGSPLAV